MYMNPWTRRKGKSKTLKTFCIIKDYLWCFQEMDHLKMAVAKIDSHNPQILLVEKSVSRFAQEYLLAKDISLVLNIKRPLLERISRCTGAQIVPSVDQLTSPKLGYCDLFHVEKFVETHGQGVKKLAKTLMYFDGCPKPLGCTVSSTIFFVVSDMRSLTCYYDYCILYL